LLYFISVLPFLLGGSRAITLGVYWEFIAEINIYINQYRPPQAWQAIAIFPKRNLDIEALTAYQREMVKRI